MILPRIHIKFVADSPLSETFFIYLFELMHPCTLLNDATGAGPPQCGRVAGSRRHRGAVATFEKANKKELFFCRAKEKKSKPKFDRAAQKSLNETRNGLNGPFRLVLNKKSNVQIECFSRNIRFFPENIRSDPCLIKLWTKSRKNVRSKRSKLKITLEKTSFPK